MNYANINEAYSLNTYEENINNYSNGTNNNNDNYIVDFTENNDTNNKINSIKLMNTYKKLNNNLNSNIELIESLENNKMVLFNFLSSIYNKHIENINIINNDLKNNNNNDNNNDIDNNINNDIDIDNNNDIDIDNNDNNISKLCDEFMMNYIENFNDLYCKWNNEIYIKKKKEIEKKIEDDQIQLNGLRKIFINTTNEIINVTKNNEKNIKNTCPICFENEINMVAIPCGHACCNLCVMKNVKYNNGKCLCCRNPLKDYIKLYIQL